ncbi:GGDEF domain-containing protein [Sporomusa acidovorans]|uniref:GGDEF domain-containing protein n=1 Tax=Sporomusa acidovorans TaxID=112900 RepID=UPI00088BFAB9|nr:GGDEF domain-containing protein [Sporomusa acidovorans]OZC19069.1 diguanylate cyclase DosC [Sporomusa acidovorans DSM 3132]SDD66278.1 diguanylate cyclase (GGDEF) domain-containing protein [Sporomusa acidovorans]
MYRYRTIMLKSLPVILGILGLLFGLSCYLLEKHAISNEWHYFYWSIFFVIQAIVGIAYGLLIRKLYHFVYTDSLTQLWNRKYFFEILKQELRCPDTSATTFLFMLDMDNFKCINDTFGHQAGDEALKALARVLQNNIHPTDVAARLGGDEFALLLRNATQETACTTAETIRQTVNSKLAKYNSSVSIGIVSSTAATGSDALLALADQALYRAKVHKDCTIFSK